MCTREQVAENVQATLEGLGLAPSEDTKRGVSCVRSLILSRRDDSISSGRLTCVCNADAEILAEVKDILKPVQGKTWPSGRPENN